MIEGIKLLLFLLTRKGLIHIVAKHEKRTNEKKKNPNLWWWWRVVCARLSNLTIT